MAKALVLGGGSLKGAWQVGAIQAVLETGFKPDMIYGISAGALNGTFMTNEIGRQTKENQPINWDLVNKQLLRFWLENITKPTDIGILRSKVGIGMDTMMSRFDGLLDSSPLHNTMRANVDIDLIRNSPVKLKVGAVNINSGEMYYASPADEHFIDYVLASSSLPFIMPAVQIGGNHHHVFMDGGVREVVPLRKAIEDGADEIFCIATHSKNRALEPFNYRSFFGLIERIKDITINQFENNDIEWAEHYEKDLMGFGQFSLKKKLKLTIIRPDEPLKLELTAFDSNGIRELIKQGYEKAYLQLQS